GAAPARQAGVGGRVAELTRRAVVVLAARAAAAAGGRLAAVARGVAHHPARAVAVLVAEAGLFALTGPNVAVTPRLALRIGGAGSGVAAAGAVGTAAGVVTGVAASGVAVGVIAILVLEHLAASEQRKERQESGDAAHEDSSGSRQATGALPVPEPS